MKLNLFSILFILSFITSCNTTSTNDNKKMEEHDVNNSNKELSATISNKINFVDSTNFDNYTPENPLNEKQIVEFQLDKLNFPAEDYFFRKELDFSNSFTTKIFTAMTEMEMKTYLITYNSTGQMIHNIIIAYDEIAESASRTITRIENSIVHIDEYNYMEDNLNKQTNSYVLNNNGEFIKMDSH